MNKKTIIIAAITIAVIILVCVITFSITGSKGNSSSSNKIINITEKLVSNIYTITRKTDDTTITIVRKDDNAYKEEKTNSRTVKYYTKDGNSYSLSENSKKIYQYANSNDMLYEFTSELGNLENITYLTGTEKINGKEYQYQEYSDYDSFLINLDLLENEENDGNREIITRLYFSNKDLKYIKTMIGNQEELIEVDIEYKANENILEWPSDYEIVQMELE